MPFGGDQEQGLQWIESHMDFGVASGFDCAGFIDMLDAVLELLAPEFALQESEAGDFIAAICDAATQ